MQYIYIYIYKSSKNSYGLRNSDLFVNVIRSPLLKIKGLSQAQHMNEIEEHQYNNSN